MATILHNRYGSCLKYNYVNAKLRDSHLLVILYCIVFILFKRTIVFDKRAVKQLLFISKTKRFEWHASFKAYFSYHWRPIVHNYQHPTYIVSIYLFIFFYIHVWIKCFYCFHFRPILLTRDSSPSDTRGIIVYVLSASVYCHGTSYLMALTITTLGFRTLRRRNSVAETHGSQTEYVSTIWGRYYVRVRTFTCLFSNQGSVMETSTTSFGRQPIITTICCRFFSPVALVSKRNPFGAVTETRGVHEIEIFNSVREKPRRGVATWTRERFCRRGPDEPRDVRDNVRRHYRYHYRYRERHGQKVLGTDESGRYRLGARVRSFECDHPSKAAHSNPTWPCVTTPRPAPVLRPRHATSALHVLNRPPCARAAKQSSFGRVAVLGPSLWLDLGSRGHVRVESTTTSRDSNYLRNGFTPHDSRSTTYLKHKRLAVTVFRVRFVFRYRLTFRIITCERYYEIRIINVFGFLLFCRFEKCQKYDVRVLLLYTN